jgi:hypothetical protein
LPKGLRARHVASLYRKIGVNRRSAEIIWARERGISVDAWNAFDRRTFTAVMKRYFSNEAA